MTDCYRIHGDNIVECERIIKIILDEINPDLIEISLTSPSVISYKFSFNYLNETYDWQIELFPGFNKLSRKRWNVDIFDVFKENGSLLDETPDVIVTKIEHSHEIILCAIEFCGAVQAGNQAWQRSGRAFSIGRTGCPYLYIADFVKYELKKDRERDKPRFPNPVVPYSYANFSKNNNSFMAQVYIRSEDFNKKFDDRLNIFDEDDFSEKELAKYLVKRMLDKDTSLEEKSILQKNMNIVINLSKISKKKTTFTSNQWKQLSQGKDNIIEFSKKNTKFKFDKKINNDSHHGNSRSFLEIVDKYSIGIAAKDLPFGIIPAEKRKFFIEDFYKLYPSSDPKIINKIASSKEDLILCIMKGFKPKGDDNRPDRGILPLIRMLTSNDYEIFTYIYGPVLKVSLDQLLHDPSNLAQSNGLWRSILILSNYVALDVPVLLKTNPPTDAKLLINTEKTFQCKNLASKNKMLLGPILSDKPKTYQENDVDTAIHYIFTHLLNDACFEGLCNPPGGDWSGLSLIDKGCEVRWLSLPRVSPSSEEKRPDHVLEIFGVLDKPILLIIESKELSSDLEENVGQKLINYIKSLTKFSPSVERLLAQNTENWTRSSRTINMDNYELISAGAYLKKASRTSTSDLEKSNCDLFFILNPFEDGWKVEIISKTEKAEALKSYIRDRLNASEQNKILIV